MQLLAKLTLAAATATLAAAQRPANMPICDYYANALLKANNATTQATVLTLVVNTAVIGNYTQPNVGVAVPGILNPNATYNGKAVNLVPYFSGMLASSNRGGNAGQSVNFLDGGGAAPLMKNMPANSTSSNQGRLLTHLYSYFGTLLGCSQVGQMGFPAYNGSTNMYEVHKFMALDAAEVGYFIQQVGLAAASFGVAQDDVTAVGKALSDTFGMRCSAPVEVAPGQGAHPQAICIAQDCPLAMNQTCSAYETVVEPKNATMTSGGSGSGGSGSGSSPSGSAASATPTTGNAADAKMASLGMMAALGLGAAILI